MQKYSSNITTSSGSALRNVAVTVKDEQGNLATLYQDRYGSTPIANPRITASDGTFWFYAANGRYTLEAMVEGVQYIDDDVVLLYDPEEVSPGEYAYPPATQQEAEDENESGLRSFSPTRIWQAIRQATASQFAQKLENITGLIQAGANVVISGSGTSADPYVIDSSGGAGGVWGAISGLLSNQSDLQSALNSKADSASLGTAAAEDVPSSGNAGPSQVVLGNDSRLSDSRTPVAHTHTLTDITDAGTAAAVDTGTGAGELPTTAQADGRYAQLAKPAHFLDDLKVDGDLDVDGAVALLQMLTVGGDPLIKAKDAAQLTGGADADFTNMIRVDGDDIVSSGSNANGYWTQFADGTMICRTLTRSQISMVSNGTTESQDWTFPKAFIHVDQVTVVANLYSGAPQNLQPPTTIWSSTTATLHLKRTDSTGTWINPIAIGRWK